MNEQRKKAPPSIDEVYKLARDNNRMLHAMRRSALIGGIVKFVFWIALFFVLPYVIFVIYLQPYLTNIQSAYSDFNNTVDTVGQTADDLKNVRDNIPNFGDFFGRFGGEN